MAQRINGEDHEYQLELARTLGAFQRTVALADSSAKAGGNEPDIELKEMMDRLTKLAFETGFEKGWKAARKVRI